MRVTFYILLIILITKLGEFMLGNLTLLLIMQLCIRMRLLDLGIPLMLKCLKRKLLLHQMNLMFHLRLLMPDEGQLVVVPPVAATTAADVLPKAKGDLPWYRCQTGNKPGNMYQVRW